MSDQGIGPEYQQVYEEFQDMIKGINVEYPPKIR